MHGKELVKFLQITHPMGGMRIIFFRANLSHFVLLMLFVHQRALDAHCRARRKFEALAAPLLRLANERACILLLSAAIRKWHKSKMKELFSM